MGASILLCIYMGYLGNGFSVITLNENGKYLFINLAYMDGQKQPAEFFDPLPYGTVCKLKIQQESGQFSASAIPGAGGGATQYTYYFNGGSVEKGAQAEITVTGEAFSVYNRESGRNIQIRVATIQGKEVVAGWNQSSKYDWYFTEAGNYNEFDNAAYDSLQQKWQSAYDAGKKLFVTMTLAAQREEYKNVWAPTESTTVKHYWVIKKIR